MVIIRCFRFVMVRQNSLCASVFVIRNSGRSGRTKQEKEDDDDDDDCEEDVPVAGAAVVLRKRQDATFGFHSTLLLRNFDVAVARKTAAVAVDDDDDDDDEEEEGGLIYVTSFFLCIASNFQTDKKFIKRANYLAWICCDLTGLG